MTDTAWSDAAAWVQAIGTVGAVIGAAWVAAGDSRAARRREERAREEAHAREAQAAAAAKTAALNLALLAEAQIHDLHLLLRDEARRGRVTRVSPSRTLPSTERLLTAFPIQSLEDADAMIAFSRFPGALATAEEIYGNLEAAVRAAEEADRPALFAEYAGQMARLETVVRRRLRELREALGLESDLADPTADLPAGAERSPP